MPVKKKFIDEQNTIVKDLCDCQSCCICHSLDCHEEFCYFILCAGMFGNFFDPDLLHIQALSASQILQVPA